MADFVAVLRKTIDGMGETTPETRERVYEKARSTIAAKLAAINPPPPAAVAERQRHALEDAIRQVEADFAPDEEVGEPADPLAALENVFASLQEKPPVTPRAVTPPPSYAAPEPWPTGVRASPPQSPASPAQKQGSRDFGNGDDDRLDNDFRPVQDDRSSVPPRDERRAPASQDERAFATVDDDDAEDDANDQTFDQAQRRRTYAGLIAAAVAFVVLAGGGYAVWLNKDEFGRMLGMGGTEVAATEPVQPEQPASAQPEEIAATAPPAGETETPKFTQRLNADGTEVDPGAAGGEPTIGEGTSVAAVTQLPSPATPPVAAGSAAPGEAAPAAPTAVAVGQKAIFYEERTNVAQGSAETGSIVWSLVQESPGGDLPPEPAIRAEASIPGKDLQLRMTIRRNGDKTLPASHIVELIFLTPDGFEGGGIESILRFTLKDSEESTGNQLLGIPAKIADGFFLVALNDTPAEIDANMTLLRREKWIDVPIVYKSGRRALITMEKGIPGDKVFDEALKAWQTSAG